MDSNRPNRLMTGVEYIESLRARKPLRLYFNGEFIENPVDHPVIRPSINSVAATYDLAHHPEHRSVATATSAITGRTINRFCHLHQSVDDLLSKIKMQRLLGQITGTCFQRCVGMDSFNAIFLTTFEMDKKFGTDYHERFIKYLIQAEDNDWIVDGCMTDVKGDRSKRPSEQVDPDMYVRVVERRPDGIVINGAKAHQTGAINSHEILVMPTMAMKPEDKDYAVICSMPADTDGVTYIYGRQSCDLRKLDTSEAGQIDSGSSCYGGQEALVIFDHVFVPNANIYMDGETEFTGLLVESFAGYHRQSYVCKTGVGDVMIGAAGLIADYNGCASASHIKDKIVEMNHLNETIYACAVACSACGTQTSAGNYIIDKLLANICKQNVTRNPYEISRLLQDIAGGLMVTLPSAKDLKNPATAHYVEKYLAGVPGITVENKMKLLRLIENMTLGRAAVGYLTESMHGAGSPQAQRIMIGRLVDMNAKKNMVKRIAKIDDVSATA